MRMFFCSALFAVLCSSAAFAQAPNPAAEIFASAEVHYRAHDYAKALAGYQEAYRLSNEPVLLFNIGQCFRHLGKYDDAIRNYRLFLEQVPDTTERENVEYLIQQAEDAKSSAAAGTSNPAEAEAISLFELAEAQYKIGEYTKALDGYKRAYLLVQNPKLLYNIGQSYRQLGRYDDAINSYKAFLRDEPDTPVRANVEELIAECEEKQKNAPPPSASLWLERNEKYVNMQNCYYLAGALGGIGGVVGGFTILFTVQGRQETRLAAGEEVDIERLFLLQNRAQKTARAANRLYLGAAVAVGAGIALKRAKEKRTLEATLTPTGAALAVQF